MKKLIIIIGTILIVAVAFLISHTREHPATDLNPGEIATSTVPAMTAHTITLADKTTFSLMAPESYTITPAVQGLKRSRFMAYAPDGRLFVTDMHDLSDNSLGKVYVLSEFNEETKTFDSTKTYLAGLRNPNSIAFYKDKSDQWWIYVALTDTLVRYKYSFNTSVPASRPETIASFPDYGLSYKYGGWHLTRTVAFHNDKVYVAVGSSCNSCEEKEAVRASIIELNPDGTDLRYYAKGLRNAVGIKWVGPDLYATDMGADHLGNDIPNEHFYKISPGSNYGWPYCYVSNGKIMDDTSIPWKNKNIPCSIVTLPDAEFPAHAAPLGLEFFNNSFLVALHGSSDVAIGSGYKIVEISEGNKVQDIISGFLKNGIRYGRPVDILKRSENSFFFTDDYRGVLYYVSTAK
jgi:glucose/arabinose dehydrogenase